MRRPSFAARTEVALCELGGGAVEVSRVTELLGLATCDRRRVAAALGDLVKGGRAERTGRGLYRPLVKERGKPDLKEIMWRYLRARVRVTREELQEISGAAAPTVKEWLAALIRRGLVVNEAHPGQPGIYRLATDQAMMPDDGLAEGQRRKRDLKKEALNKLDAAWASLAEARLAITRLED